MFLPSSQIHFQIPLTDRTFYLSTASLVPVQMSNAFSSAWGFLAAWLPQACTIGRVPMNNFAESYLWPCPMAKNNEKRMPPAHLLSKNKFSSSYPNQGYNMPIFLVSEVLGHLIALRWQSPPCPYALLFAQRTLNSNKCSIYSDRLLQGKMNRK